MTYRILLFAAAAERLGSPFVELELPEQLTIGQLACELAASQPRIAPIIAISRWAVDESFVRPETVVQRGQEIALIPPVSGG
jgi:molybdopterin converting factor subunit 1